jgi:ketopantoate reductase
VNTDVYKDIFMAFVDQLDDIELRQGYFQEDGATCHTSNESMALIYLKERVYKNKPRTIQDLRANITTEINIIDTAMLTRVSENKVKRAQMCLEEEGGHFQHLM